MALVHIATTSHESFKTAQKGFKAKNTYEASASGRLISIESASKSSGGFSAAESLLIFFRIISPTSFSENPMPFAESVALARSDNSMQHRE